MLINRFEDLPNLSNADKISLDIETHDPNLKTQGPGAIRGDGRIIGIGIAVVDGPSFYIPETLLFERNKIVDWFSQYQFDLILGQNILYDLEWLACYGLRFRPRYFLDTMFAEGLLVPLEKKDLDTLGKKYVSAGKLVDELEHYLVNVIRVPKKQWANHIHKAPKELVFKYCINDAELVIKIFREQKKQLISLDLLPVFLKECRLIPILLEMKLKGIKVNQFKIKEYYPLIEGHIKDACENLNGLNVEAPKQVAEFLKKKDTHCQ